MFEIKEIELIESKSKENKPIYKMLGVGDEKSLEIEIQRKSAGRFILATNLVDDEKLEPSEILMNYKNQQSCVREACRRQRGFRFLKDPLFFYDYQSNLLCLIIFHSLSY
jgi:hypothetical protein